jgi:hypothetical protein
MDDEWKSFTKAYFERL